jgi:hypothetical protein
MTQEELVLDREVPMERRIYVGDMVRLKSTGVYYKMTVERLDFKCQIVHCVWMVHGIVQRNKFPAVTLIRVPSDPATVEAL